MTGDAERCWKLGGFRRMALRVRMSPSQSLTAALHDSRLSVIEQAPNRTVRCHVGAEKRMFFLTRTKLQTGLGAACPGVELAVQQKAKRVGDRGNILVPAAKGMEAVLTNQGPSTTVSIDSRHWLDTMHLKPSA